MSVTPEELIEIKARAEDAIENSRDDEKAARIAMDVLILLLVIKIEQGDANATAR